MFSRIFIITAVAAAFAAVAAPAAWGDNWGADRQQRADFWNYDSQTGKKTTDASPGVAPQDLATLYSTSGSDVSGPIGSSNAVEPQWMKALQARSEALNRQHGLGDNAAMRALELRSQELNRFYRLGEFSWMRGIEARSEALNRQHRLGEYTVNPIDARERALVEKRVVQLRSEPARGTIDHFTASDNRFQIDSANNPPVTVTAASGREIELPQIGIGVGIVIVLLVGLFVAFRVTRSRPLAHG